MPTPPQHGRHSLPGQQSCPYTAQGPSGEAHAAGQEPARGAAPPTGPAYTLGSAPRALPVLGHGVALLRDPLGFMTSLSAHGDLVRVRVGRLTAIAVCHPDLVRRMLLNDRVFDKGGFLWDRLREVVGVGLANIERERHRSRRRMMQPAFHREQLRVHAAVMSQQIAEHLGTWQDRQTLDVRSAMLTMAGVVAGRTMFAACPDDQVIADVHTALDEIVRCSYHLMLFPSPLHKLPSPTRRRFEAASARLREITTGFIRSYRRSGIDHHDLLSKLLAARDDSGQPLSEVELCAHVASLFLAGTETTATAMSWSLHLIAQHPEVQTRLHQEADQVLCGRIASWEHLPRLTYTRAVLTEALRLFPPVWLLTRATSTDTVLGGHQIAAGTVMLYSPHIVHHRPDVHHDPERFDPDRWADAPVGHDSPLQHDAWQPFGMGARRCIGDTFALTEATLTLASIAARWHVEPAPGAVVRPMVKAVSTPASLRVVLHARSSNPAAPEPTEPAHIQHAEQE